MEALTPAQTTLLISSIASKKARQRLDKMFVNCVAGSFLLGFGCAINISTSASPWFQENAPGLIKTISACFFPVGLIMCFLSGADLFTSYCMYSVVALLNRRISIIGLIKTWAVSFLANLVGMLFFAIVLVGYGGLFASGPFHKQAIHTATAKVLNLTWAQIFLRGILANWLVTMAAFLSISSREVSSKIISIWFPTMTFTAIGGEHVVANMFYIPLGIFLGAPKVTVGMYIWKSMLPSALGNVLGGGLFVGTLYWYLYLTSEEGQQHHETTNHGNTSEHTFDGSVIKGANVLTLENSPA